MVDLMPKRGELIIGQPSLENVLSHFGHHRVGIGVTKLKGEREREPIPTR
jgi:hypothetical protein